MFLKKRIRILLRVSSNQQLEADGDLTVQRALVTEYIQRHPEWEFDGKEYFEGSNSGYKNSVEDRDILQEALQDAREKKYDILVVYKDDRIGRRMWEVGAYIMNLKSYGVDVYTVKDGCISANFDDVMGQVMLALRYGVAQKSSADTGLRVKDTAQKLVQAGRFMGGAAPYGYRLVLSGELSKHGRALHKLVIIPNKAEVVRHIYDLSLRKEFGSAKIARTLNESEYYKSLAPNDVWKGGTITSILTNPIYAGHVAYKRRERVNGKYHRLSNENWIKSNEADENIKIIDGDMWDRTQDKRKQRKEKFTKKLENQNVTVIGRNDGMLPLVDVLYCGYCGCKMVNGSKYSYWTIKSTGERRTKKIPIYKCQDAWNGVPHDKKSQFKAEEIDPIIFDCLSEYIEKLQENENIFEQVQEKQSIEKKAKEANIKKEEDELNKILKDIETMESNIPSAMREEYFLSLEKLSSLLKKSEEQAELQKQVILNKKLELQNMNVTASEWESLCTNLPTWREVFLSADVATKRALVNKLIERIDITNEQMVVRFKISLSEFLQHRIGSDSVV